MSGFVVMVAWLLDILSLRFVSEPLFERFAKDTSPAYPVHRAIWRMLHRGRLEDAFVLAEASWKKTSSPRVGRDLVNIYMRKGMYEEARKVASAMSELNPESVWFGFLEADICEYFLGDHDASLAIYRRVDPLCEKHPRRRYALGVLFKRLGRLYRDLGDKERLEETLERHFAITPSNFLDEDFLELCQLNLDRGDRERAKEVLEVGFEASKRSVALREAYERFGFGAPPPIPPRKIHIPDMPDVTKIPVRTRIFHEGDDPVSGVKEYAVDKVREGDIVTLSSCVAAVMEGRMVMEGTVSPTATASAVGKLIGRSHPVGPWATSAPMANPLSVQAVLEEIGTLRLLLATVIGAVGTLLGKSGWFYVICGPQAGQVDDIPGAIPPYDYYVVMGALNAHDLANRMASAMGSGIGAAIVDANDLGIAWAVGHSDGAEPREIERMMIDNPAGNGEEQTPVVILRRENARGRLESVASI